MKKLFFFALAAVAMLTTGCEKLQQSELSEADLKDKVSINGYVRYTVNDSKGTAKKPEFLADQPIVLYYGTKDKDGNMTYTHYDLKTDADGCFSKQLYVKPGQAIDEVKVVCSFSMEDATYAYNKDSKRWELTSADFYGQVTKQNLAVGSSYYFPVEVAAVAYTSNPSLTQPGE